MGCKHFLLVCATAVCLYVAAIAAQTQGRNGFPRTRFSCQGRPSGYYADVETGCQVYHMCDGLGRQFSYSCPNTTLFQQRMLICDHWYMVNCSMSERDYDANLLIGQRDKPFVSEEEMRLRTPRPDILNVPPNSNFYEGLKEAESKLPFHPSNSIVGIPDTLSNNNNGLDSAKQNYRPPTSWSAGTGHRPTTTSADDEEVLTGAASQRPGFVKTTPEGQKFTQNTGAPITPPSRELSPPPAPTTESPDEFVIDVRMKEEKEDPVVKFINRFDPNSPDSHKTAMTRSEILSLNQHLPAGQSSAEEERAPRKQKNGNDFNSLQGDKKGTVENSRFNTVNLKPNPAEGTLAGATPQASQIPPPSNQLQPPKRNYAEQPISTSTHGPPIYLEWKFAGAPVLGLEPPKPSNDSTTSPSAPQQRNVSGRNPFSTVTRPPPIIEDIAFEPKNTEYNISSYFVPDYVFPLDNDHRGYEDEDARTSFQVKVGKPGQVSYGENPACPHCHPAYLNPGSCEPCIVKR